MSRWTGAWRQDIRQAHELEPIAEPAQPDVMPDGLLEPDEKALLDAMAAFKAGAVSDIHVRDMARRLMKMAHDELGEVVDAPEGVMITPARGVDRYIVVPPERPDAAGKVGLMLLLPLHGGTTFPVYEGRPVGSVRVEDPQPVASVDYSVAAGVDGRIAELERRRGQIATEYGACFSREGRSALKAEQREIESELLELRSHERTTV